MMIDDKGVLEMVELIVGHEQKHRTPMAGLGFDFGHFFQ